MKLRIKRLRKGRGFALEVTLEFTIAERHRIGDFGLEHFPIWATRTVTDIELGRFMEYPTFRELAEAESDLRAGCARLEVFLTGATLVDGPDVVVEFSRPAPTPPDSAECPVCRYEEPTKIGPLRFLSERLAIQIFILWSVLLGITSLGYGFYVGVVAPTLNVQH